MIADLFPSIEHLKINAAKLNNVQFVRIYLVSLRNLALKFVYSIISLIKDIRQERWNHILCPENRFLFTQSKEWITLWIDESTFEGPFWQSFQLIHKEAAKRRTSKVRQSRCICC
ncbi:unnamed protein product [Rotaria sordida]|uniref:Uncharacterized protein n=1 Tax=Rotaria sordida TaxID=392033 RepID=A0A814RZL1_9BILA|nr:unnamed protein product [Rotaria sordida]